MTGGFSWYLPEVDGLLQAGWCQKCGMGWIGGLPLEERDESTKVCTLIDLIQQCQDISPSIHSIPSTESTYIKNCQTIYSLHIHRLWFFSINTCIVQKVRPTYFFEMVGICAVWFYPEGLWCWIMAWDRDWRSLFSWDWVTWMQVMKQLWKHIVHTWHTGHQPY